MEHRAQSTEDRAQSKGRGAWSMESFTGSREQGAESVETLCVIVSEVQGSRFNVKFISM
jgi:hypothetical protein